MKRKWLFKDYYDTTIIILALISVVLVLLGFAEMVDLDNPPYNIIDLLLWGVFVVDYGWRFFFRYLVGIWCGIMFTNDIGEVV